MDNYILEIYNCHGKRKPRFILALDWGVDEENLSLAPVRVKLDKRCACYNYLLEDALKVIPNNPTLLSMKEVYGDDYNLFTPITLEQLEVVKTWDYTKKIPSRY